MSSPKDTDNQNTQNTTPISQVNMPRQYHETDPLNTNAPPNTSASEKAQLDTNGVPSKNHNSRRQSIIIASMLTVAVLAAGIGFYFFSQSFDRRELDTTANLESPEEDGGLLAENLEISLSTMPEALDELAELFTERYSDFQVIDVELVDDLSEFDDLERTVYWDRNSASFCSEVYDMFIGRHTLAGDVWSVHIEKRINPVNASKSEARQGKNARQKELDALHDKIVAYRAVIEDQFIDSGFTKMNLMEELSEEVSSRYNRDLDPKEVWSFFDTLAGNEIKCIINNLPAHWYRIQDDHDSNNRKLSRASIGVHCAPIAVIDAAAKERLPFKMAPDEFHIRRGIGLPPSSTSITLSRLSVYDHNVPPHYRGDAPYPWGETPTSPEERRFSEKGYEYAYLGIGSVLYPAGATCAAYRKPDGLWTVAYCGHGTPYCNEVTDTDAQKAFYDQVCFYTIDEENDSDAPDDRTWDTLPLIGEYWDL